MPTSKNKKIPKIQYPNLYTSQDATSFSLEQGKLKATGNKPNDSKLNSLIEQLNSYKDNGLPKNPATGSLKESFDPITDVLLPFGILKGSKLLNISKSTATKLVSQPKESTKSITNNLLNKLERQANFDSQTAKDLAKIKHQQITDIYNITPDIKHTDVNTLNRLYNETTGLTDGVDDMKAPSKMANFKNRTGILYDKDKKMIGDLVNGSKANTNEIENSNVYHDNLFGMSKLNKSFIPQKNKYGGKIMGEGGKLKASSRMQSYKDSMDVYNAVQFLNTRLPKANSSMEVFNIYDSDIVNKGQKVSKDTGIYPTNDRSKDYISYSFSSGQYIPQYLKKPTLPIDENVMKAKPLGVRNPSFNMEAKYTNVNNVGIPDPIDIMMPSGDRVSKQDFIKQYGNSAWLKAINKNNDYKNNMRTINSKPERKELSMLGKGGFLKGLGDIGLMFADNAASVINKDIIKDSAYSDTGFGKAVKDIGGINQSIVNAAAPIAATAIGGPMAGMAMSQIQGMSNSFVKPDIDRQQSDIGLIGDGLGNAVSTAGNFYNPNVSTFKNGGQTNMIDINVEGSNKSQGAMVNMKKGEYLVKDGKIIRNFINLPPHPVFGMNNKGTVSAPEGSVVIPKNKSEEYSQRSLKDRQLIEKSLISKQIKRDDKLMMKYGGILKKYGGPPDGNSFVEDFDAGNVDYVFNPQYDYDGNINGNMKSLLPNFSKGRDFKMMDNIFNRNGFEKNPSNTGNFNKALSYAPAAYNISRGLFGKVDKLNPNDYTVNDNIQWENITDNESIRSIADSYNLANYNLKNSGRLNQSGQVALFNARANAMAGSRERINNLNKQGKYNANLANIDNKFKNNSIKLSIQDINAKRQATKQESLAEGIGNLGQIGVQNNYNDTFFESLQAAYKDPEFRKLISKYNKKGVNNGNK